jgi:hypothetical protein
MTSFLWKAPLVVILALLAAAANLVTHGRARLGERTPVQLAPALRPPPDGLARAKRASVHAAQVEALRSAVILFNENEGHPPQSLTELAANGYLRGSKVPDDLRHFRYDPSTLSVTEIDR